MKKMQCNGKFLLLVLSAMLLLSGCSVRADTEKPNETLSPPAAAEKPPLPEKLSLNAQGVPVLKVYDTDEEKSKEMDIETYLLGVLAGEMKNDWPMEALKAQAILARTFVLKFCTEKESKYQGADISTDIEEAQAYDETGINERIEQAVGETKGLVLSHGGELPYAWFHAHSGGTTAFAKEGLAYQKDEPGYTKITEGKESEKAPDEAKKWRAEFPVKIFLKGAKEAGWESKEETIQSVKTGSNGKSGRAETILINDIPVSVPDLRIALGSSIMRSTLLDKLVLENNEIIMEGKGYGHGVGMPQWGAYGMAEEGKTAEEIVTYYFQDVSVEKMW